MSNPRDARAAARDLVRHLTIPNPLGRAQQVARSRTPSPTAPGAFFDAPGQPQTPQQFADAPAETEQADPPILTLASTSASASASSTNMADETVQALTNALQGVRVSSRKPEVPAFDPKNVDIWLKRVDNAYRRAGITDPKDKFAFIEPKFAVGTDARVNELLFGEGTEVEWTEFQEYLRGRYGRTKSQQAAVILDGVPRDGKLPSEMYALVKERIGTITIDDVVKEMVMRELPTEIKRTIHEKVKDLSGAEAVKIADQYFDRNGKPIHKASESPVNTVDDVPGLIDTDDEDDVNAFGRPFQRKGNKSRPPRKQPDNNSQFQKRTQPKPRQFPPSNPPTMEKTHALRQADGKTIQPLQMALPFR